MLRECSRRHAFGNVRGPLAAVAITAHRRDAERLQQRGELSNNIVGAKRWLPLAHKVERNAIAVQKHNPEPLLAAPKQSRLRSQTR